MTIRDARLGDEELLSRLHHAVFETSVWEEAFWHESILDENCVVLIASVDGTMGGLIAARHILDEAEILTIGVIQTERGKGHARALLSMTQARLKQSGVARVFLEVAEDNEAAIRLYTGSGFRDVGHRKDYYGPAQPAIVMEWQTGLPGDGDDPRE